MVEYKKVTISGIDIEYRKWKVKDKLELDRIDSDTSLQQLDRQLKKREVFVYNCMKERKQLDIEQYNYLLSLIRDYSLHNKIEFSLECPKCKAQFIRQFSTPEIITFRESEYKDIKVKDKVFKMGNVTNEDYDRDILGSFSNAERFIVDFAYHVQSINDEVLEVKDIIEVLEDLDVDDYQTLFTEFDSQKFLCDFSKGIECPECSNVELFQFDNLTSFFPSSWGI